MIIKSKEKLNLILNLPFNNNIIVGDLKYHQKEINLKKRIGKLYMDSIGFTPKFEGKKCHYYGVDIYNDSVFVDKRLSYGDGSSSGGEGKDISNSEILNVSNLLNGFTFMLSENKGDSVSIKKYTINKEDEDTFSIDKIDEISLCFKNKNLIVLKDNEEIDITDIKDFFDNIDYGQREIYNNIIPFIYESFVLEKGFLDIYEEYKSFIRRTPYYSNDYDIFSYYYYIGQLDFYYLAEHLIKSGIEVNLSTYNPVVTGKPIQKIKDIPVLSKNGVEMMKKYRISSDNTILYEIEADKKIGKDGLKIIEDYLTALDNIDANYNSVFRNSSFVERLLKNISIIINTFDITPKNLMDRLTRAIFYENYRIDSYMNLIIDTIIMSKDLKIELGNKLPKDIVVIHDLLADQIEYIENEKAEELFKEYVQLNNNLLKLLPHSDEFTIISPSSPNDLVKEGLRLKHCVGSYINRYVSGYSKIFFVRKKSNTNEPFVTLELGRNNELVQSSAFANKCPNESVNKFITEWTKQIKDIKVEV